VVYAKTREQKEVAVKYADRQSIQGSHPIMNEQRILRQLTEGFEDSSSSPPFVPLLAAFYDDHLVYLVFPLCCGGELSHHIPLNPETISSCCQQLIEAIYYLHQRDIVHGDLSPSNVLIKDGRLMLSDFGGNAGTAAFAAPEVSQGKPTSKASDIWSYACIWHAMWIGKSPFWDESEALILERIMKPLELDQNIPPECRERMALMLLVDATKRTHLGDSLYNTKGSTSFKPLHVEAPWLQACRTAELRDGKVLGWEAFVL